MKKIFSVFFAFLMLMLFKDSHAQTFSPSVTPAQGGYYSNSAGVSFSYTIGEPSNTTLNNGSNIFSQGFEQPEVQVYTGTVATGPFCANTAISVPYTTKGIIGSNNVFTAQLSNASGSFAAPVNIGTLVSNTSGTINAVIPTGTIAGTGYRIRVKSSLPEFSARDNGANITVINPSAKPATPGAISGTTPICPDLTVYSYSIASVTNATTYTWTIPANCTLLSGQGTTSITVQFTSLYTGGSIKVTAGNCIGTSGARTLTVAKKVKPATPGTISGTTPVCTGNSYAYSIAPIANATTYTWSVPANATLVGGQGSTNVTVSFQAGYVTSNISVTAGNCGGTSAAKTLSIAKATAPATPGVITGAVAVCPGVYTYSVPAQATASSFTWTSPANASITNGQGTNTVEITFDAGFTTGTLSVVANNCSGTSAARTLALKTTPGAPAAITGPIANVCGTTTGIVYSIAPILGASSYTWAVTGGTITGGQGTTSITVDFPAVFASATVKVKEITSCSSSGAYKSVTVKQSPTVPGTITGNASVCPTTSNVYSVASVTGATGYTWTIPTDWSITAGDGTTAITVTAGSTSGYVKVAAGNSCATSTFKSKTVSIGTGCRLANPNTNADEVFSLFSNFNVYPNPSTDVFNISFDANEEGRSVQVQLMSIDGKLIQQEVSSTTIGPNKIELQWNNAATGVYILQIQSGDVVKRVRVVKE